MPWPTARYKIFAPGGSHLPADSNGMQDLTLNATGWHLDGFTSIAATETRTNPAFGLMTTPDRVSNVVVPSSQLLFVLYQATWQESVAGAASAAIFLGANQLKMARWNQVAPVVSPAATIGGGTALNQDTVLASCANGLASVDGFGVGAAYTGDVTTGQIIGGGLPNTHASGNDYGFCSIMVAAGTYDVSVQFAASAGNVVAKNRKLWVWTAT